MPEAIKNKDGTKKQDFELNVSKRFIINLRAAHPRQKFLLCGDGLMSNQPLLEETHAGDMHYSFVAKPGNHKYLVEWSGLALMMRCPPLNGLMVNTIDTFIVGKMMCL
jgi:hypothetical protein